MGNIQWGFVFILVFLCFQNYYDVIKKPMDLSSIRNKLHSGSYKTPWEYVDDVWLMFDNAWLFNKKTTRVYKYCTKVNPLLSHSIFLACIVKSWKKPKLESRLKTYKLTYFTVFSFVFINFPVQLNFSCLKYLRGKLMVWCDALVTAVGENASISHRSCVVMENNCAPSPEKPHIIIIKTGMWAQSSKFVFYNLYIYFMLKVSEKQDSQEKAVF